MAGIPRQIMQQLFGRESLEETPLEDLKDLVEQFPSFNAGHFLLSKKLKMEEMDEFTSETQRTALHFTNPFWLQFQLEREQISSFQDLSLQHEPDEVLTSMEERIAAKQHSPVFETHVEPEAAMDPVKAYSQDLSADSLSDLKIEQPPIPETQPFESGSPADPDHVKDEPAANALVMPSLEQQVQDPDELMEESLAEIAMSRFDDDEKLHQAQDSVFEETEAIQENNIRFSGISQEEAITEDSYFEDHKTEAAPAADEMSDSEKERFDEPFGNKEPAFESENDLIRAREAEVAAANPPEDLHEEEAVEPVYSGQEAEMDMPAQKPEQGGQRTYYFWEKEFYSNRNINEPAYSSGPAVYETDSTQIAEGSLSDQPVNKDSDSEAPGDQIENPIIAPEELIVFAQDPIILAPLATGNEELPVVEAPATTQESGFTMAGNHELPKAVIQEPLEELQFTPYHTIDYFASQGIQYEQEENPPDKFGRQLKSFTAWLKSMKKLPKAVMETEMSEITEAAIQSIAEHSIEEKEVITEAMAEVLVLQGRTDKAIELYNKLSLLNPAKSAFFAARIDQLKVN